ncbi:PspC domain-containing protein [Sphaerisporangium album]|uniref:PspC domain-containing protein n=1 Tax=Sphaerisporangium album TaxID=509200 RepID=A0A367F274_9ACTN|nr:PspC domain-containing protein [Sphaerisporangium album]RCG24478.1 PspC domain-containing protein [Sphaerisporangium album]
MTEAGSAGTTHEPEEAPDEPRVLQRSDEGRMLTGVCAGLGRYVGMDPVIFRVGFAVLVVGSGIGIMLYVAAFLLMRNSNGGPGYVEQWSRRVFDADTVMAILAAILALGLVINVAADGIGTSTIAVGTLLAIALLAAHGRGVDLLAVTKSLPERVKGRRGVEPVPGPWAHGPQDAGAYAHNLAQNLAQSFTQNFGRTFGRQDTPEQARSTASGTTAGPAYAPGTTAGPMDAPGPAAGPMDAPGAAAGPADTPVDAPPDYPPPSDAPADPRQAAPGAGQAYERPEPEYRRLSDLAREARGGGFDSSGEPFAPRGPYSSQRAHSAYGSTGSLGAYGPPQAYEPHDWGYTRRAATAPARPKRPKSFIGGITVFAAFVVGGIMVATQSSSSTLNFPVVGAAVLITIGAGLLVATWFGRGAGLVATGTLMSILLVAGSTVNGIPKKIGSYTWEPLDSSQAVRAYAVGIGDGTLDLSDTKFAPGSYTRFDASVSIGELKVIVPATARVKVFGYTKLGDVKIEHAVQGGTDVHHDKILEPDVTPTGAPAVIELHVKAGIGDVEVHRAA